MQNINTPPVIPDNATLEYSGGKIQIKAYGVTAGKINASAVTEVKINALAVTEGKIGALAVTAAKLTRPLVAWTNGVIGVSTQATTDGFLIGYVTVPDVPTQTWTLKTDNTNPPTTVICKFDNVIGGIFILPFCCPVKKDDYYLITADGGGQATTVFWIPLGS